MGSFIEQFGWHNRMNTGLKAWNQVASFALTLLDLNHE